MFRVLGFILGLYRVHMSIRRNSLNNPMPWASCGGPIAFGFCVGYRKGIAGVVQPKHGRGYVLDREVSLLGFLSLLGLFARFLRLAGFLLFVHNT